VRNIEQITQRTNVVADTAKLPCANLQLTLVTHETQRANMSP
jgi:hypothetical protein